MTKSPCNKCFRAALLAVASATVLCGCGESLHDTAHRRDIGLAQSVLARDPSAIHARNRIGKTPLHYAVTYGQPDFINLFVAYGADVAAADNTGLTPLHVAAMLGREEEAGRLLIFKSPVDARDRYGDTPLHLAAIFNRPALAELIGKAGADVSARNNAGLTPLECARAHRRMEAAAAIESLEARP